MHDEDAVFACKSQQSLQHLYFRQFAGRHVRIVHEHEFYPVDRTIGYFIFHDCFQLLEIRKPVCFLPQMILGKGTTSQANSTAVGRVTGIGDQGNVSLIQVGHANVHNALLASDQREDLVVRIQRNPIPAGVPVRYGLAK